jgi:hypothetical protein
MRKVLVKTDLKQFTSDDLEVNSSKIEGFTNYVGIFRCRVIQQRGYEQMGRDQLPHRESWAGQYERPGGLNCNRNQRRTHYWFLLRRSLQG